MSKKQLVVLFLCNLAPFTVGSGLVPLLPVYATRLGADPALAGYYLSFIFLALAVSTGVAGWLSDRFQRRKLLLMIGGVIAVPSTWLIGQATGIPQLMLFTAVLWFVGGVMVTMVSILAGLFAEEHERGRVFGIITLALPLGALLGGLAAGRIVDMWGYPALFAAAALFQALVPLSALFLADKVTARGRVAVTRPARRMSFNKPFLLLFFASILANIAYSEFSLARTLIMDNLRFDATAITSTAAIGGLLSLPLPAVVGWLSDRLGRKLPLALCFLAVAASLLVLAVAVNLWQFWLATALALILNGTLAVGSALATDLFPKESLSKPLSLFNATPWIGYVIGYGGAGSAIQTVGMTPGLLIGVLLTAIAIFLAVLIRQPALKYQPAAD
jgi:MFS family permease